MQKDTYVKSDMRCPASRDGPQEAVGSLPFLSSFSQLHPTSTIVLFFPQFLQRPNKFSLGNENGSSG
jgi:hypothetical protein